MDLLISLSLFYLLRISFALIGFGVEIFRLSSQLDAFFNNLGHSCCSCDIVVLVDNAD